MKGRENPGGSISDRRATHLARVAASQIGRKRSPEARARMAAAQLGRKNPEHAERMRGNRYVQDAPVKGACVYCGAPATTFDHVVPLSRGGLDTPENRVPACLSCNSAKSDRTPEEWLNVSA